MNDLADNRQAKTQSSGSISQCPVLLGESVKHKGEEFGFDAFSRIRHDTLDSFAAFRYSQRDRTSSGCKFDGIVQQIGEDLAEPPGIGVKRRDCTRYVGGNA